MSRLDHPSYLNPLSVSGGTRRVELRGFAVLFSFLTALGAMAAPNEIGFREGQALLAERKWPEAAIVFKAALQRDPGSASASLGLARALTYAGRREEALSVLVNGASRQKGQARKSLIRRARVLSQTFLSNQSFQSYQDGLNLLISRKYRPARERFERALELEPDNVEILTRLGQSLVMSGDHDSAAERLRLAKKLNPYEAEISLWLGRALHQRGELMPAVDELRFAVRAMPVSELAPVWLAEALASSAQVAQAIQTLEDDLKVQPLHVQSLVTASRLRYQLLSRDPQALWNARRDLQVAESRLGRYTSNDLPKFEGELGLDLRKSSTEAKEEIQTLLQRIQYSLESPTQPVSAEPAE